MAKKGQTFRRYSLELKLEAARLVNGEHMSIREVAKCLGIQNKSQVQVWAAKTKQGMSLNLLHPNGDALGQSFPVPKKSVILAGGD